MLLSLLVGCALGSSSPETEPVTPSDVLDHIAAVGATAPFTASGVEKALGATLAQTSDTEYFTIYAGEAPPTWSGITVMAAKPGATNGGSVALQVGADPCITVDLARERFGFAHASPAHPGAPAPYERYQHTQEWGTLILGYDRDTRCLREATLRAK